MKASSLIEYLKKYIEDNGDVDLDVEIGGNPKTPPPEDTSIDDIDNDDTFEKIMEDWSRKKESEEKKNPAPISPKRPWREKDDLRWHG